MYIIFFGYLHPLFFLLFNLRYYIEISVHQIRRIYDKRQNLFKV
jgi:hypothetical protein